MFPGEWGALGISIILALVSRRGRLGFANTPDAADPLGAAVSTTASARRKVIVRNADKVASYT